MKKIIFIVLGISIFLGVVYLVASNKNKDSHQNINASKSSQKESSVNFEQDARKNSTSKPTQMSGDQEFWTKRCDEQGNDYCEIFQRLVVKESNQRLIEFAIGYPEKKKDAQAVIILPLGVAVSKGIVLTLDGRKPTAPIEIKTCTPDGCMVIMQLDKAFVEQMSSSKNIVVGFYDAQNNPANVQVELAGFSKQLKLIQ